MTTTTSALSLPFREALDYLAQKTNATSTHWTDVWQRANARAFTVAGATTQALVQDFRAEVTKALEQGTTLAEFRKGFDAIVRKHGWAHTGTPGWRSRIIYETNLSMAYSAGRYAQLTEPETLAQFPYWQYVHSGARHPRLQHLAWNGKTLRADDPFWSYAYPPNGWRCGCRVRPVSARGLARMGKNAPDEAPPLETYAWRNPKTGQVHQVPKGIDPGFDYNPGEAWQQARPAIPSYATLTPPPPIALPVTPAPPLRAPAAEPSPAQPPDEPPIVQPAEPAPPGVPIPPLSARDLGEALTEDFRAWGESLSESERAALRHYKASGYISMNAHMRGLESYPELAGDIRVLDGALARARTERPIAVYRRISDTDPLRRARLGTRAQQRAFVSSTIDLAITDSFPGMLVEIRVPKGYHGAAYVQHYPELQHDQLELLFRPGSRFRVLSRTGERIVLEAIDEPSRRPRLTPRPARRRQR